jgi:hypothetical protein
MIVRTSCSIYATVRPDRCSFAASIQDPISLLGEPQRRRPALDGPNGQADRCVASTDAVARASAV